jgi:hypothetical protein
MILKFNCLQLFSEKVPSRLQLLVFIFVTLGSVVYAQSSVPEIVVSNTVQPNSFPLVDSNQAVPLYYDANDYKGVIRAIGDLQSDIERVTNRKPQLNTSNIASAKTVIIGTLGQSALIDKLVKLHKINAADLKGKWESFVITTVSNPMLGVEQALVIAGSDKRGTIYGIYELSKQLGVSPWYWWADVPVVKRPAAYISNGYFASGEPKVHYRGIFINDEIPSMTNWAKEKFGGMNSKMYTHMFELMLRLRANILWPGMWGSMKEYEPTKPILLDENGNYEGNSFNEDDPENPRLADEYGIIMGTSHHEPMQRSQQEWLRNKKNYGNGEWNYVTNKAGIQKFFKEGIEHTKNYESLITMGMRGDDDKPMADAGSAEANFKVLEGIMKDQRQIIEEVTGKPAAKTPQVWTLYSEVLDYFDKGMKVPNDMLILLCDDNWGNIRRLPDLNGKRHPGGYGMYYHLGYYGAPRSYKWLNVTQIVHMWEQLQLTYDYGVDKMWILNVGDLKPDEYPMSFFLDMAWNPKAFNEKNLTQYAHKFYAQQLGESQAEEAARIMDTYCKYTSRVTPEMLDEKTYNLESGEFKMVKDEFMSLEARALRQYLTIPDSYKDTYKQLILFPVQAMANIYDMYYSVAMNRKLSAEKDASANDWADHVEYCFKRDAELTADYNHNMANGKWNHMMDQVHIGFTAWNTPRNNIMPKVTRIKSEEVKQGGYIFNEKNGVVVMEAEHYFEAKNSDKTNWTIIPDLGRTLSGLALMPYSRPVDGASVSYKMKLNNKANPIKVRFILDCTMPFISGGHAIAASFGGGQEKTININNQLTWKYNYSKMYPTAAARIIEVELSLDRTETNDNIYTLKYRPLNPGIVLEKIIIDTGGYENSFLKMSESPYKR